MARGLSDLQVFILKEAATRGVVFRRDIKGRFYGWKPFEVERIWNPQKLGWDSVQGADYESIATSPRTLRHAGRGFSSDSIFSKRAVGTDEYNAVSVAITKTIARLLKRGLVEWCFFYMECEPYKGQKDVDYIYEWGVVLSVAGKAYAQAMLRVTPIDAGEAVDGGGRVIGYADGKNSPGLAGKKFTESRKASGEQLAAFLQLNG